MTSAAAPDNRGSDAPPPDDAPRGGSLTTRPEESPSSTALVAQTTGAPEGGAAVLAARAEAEIKARAFIAIQRPRDFGRFRRKMIESASRPRFADAAIYSKPMGDGKVEGLSIRFAEECARHYGNLDISSMVIGENDEYRTIECSVTDLETNSVWRQNVVVPKTVERKKTKTGDEVLRTRTNTGGQVVYIRRATMDEVFTQQNALISKTIRTLILNHIPSDVKEEIYESMESLLAGEIRADPIEYRKKQVDAFFRLGVTEAQLAEYLGKPHADANEAELNMLASIGRGIKQNEATWAEVMELKRGTKPMAMKDEAASVKTSGATATLKDKLASDGVPAHIAAIRAKPAAKRSDDEKEELRQYDEDHPAKA